MDHLFCAALAPGRRYWKNEYSPYEQAPINSKKINLQKQRYTGIKLHNASRNSYISLLRRHNGLELSCRANLLHPIIALSNQSNLNAIRAVRPVSFSDWLYRLLTEIDY